MPPLARYVLLAVLGAAAGVALTLVLGPPALNVIVLGFGIALVALIARSVLRPRAKPLLPSIAVQGGHAVWLLFGAITLLASGNWLGLVEVAALASGLVWLARAPGRQPAIFLLAIHVLVILLLVVGRLGGADPGAQLPLLALHAGLRIAGSYLMLRGLNTIWRRDRRTAPRLA